ncbi:MAG: endo alpha-1,4 polygalactosaminidase [Gammaproteobacteria bacterium]|nr:MAG: endo alpha-1,4 polygalactosaminidase [Gammaproteobacteria bacterium]
MVACAVQAQGIEEASVHADLQKYRLTAYYGGITPARIYIDADGDRSTGAAIHGIGADYWIEQEGLYRFEDEAWVAEAPATDKGGLIYWDIAKDALPLQPQAVVIFTGVTGEVSAPVGWHPPSWVPGVNDHWQVQYTGPIDINVPVSVMDIDLFETSPELIAELHRQGKRVVCYFSAGSFEDWRPDADAFPPEVIGLPLEGWAGEWWLDIRRIDVLAPIMAGRMDLAVSKGCDGVDPDNVDGYVNPTGFELSAADQIRYNHLLATMAHERGLAVDLKNALGLFEDLEPYFDWVLNEECFAYGECQRLKVFSRLGKAVWGISYVERRAEGPAKALQICPQANRHGFAWLIKTLELDAWRIDCMDRSYFFYYLNRFRRH